MIGHTGTETRPELLRGGNGRESSAMDESLAEQRRVSERRFQIVKLCCKRRTGVRVESSHCDGILPERDG